jgi:hypothetical protein
MTYSSKTSNRAVFVLVLIGFANYVVPHALLDAHPYSLRSFRNPTWCLNGMQMRPKPLSGVRVCVLSED